MYTMETVYFIQDVLEPKLTFFSPRTVHFPTNSPLDKVWFSLSVKILGKICLIY